MDNREVKEAECNNNDFSFVCEYDCSSVGKKLEKQLNEGLCYKFIITY